MDLITPPKNTSLNLVEMRNAQKIFRALCHEKRLEIINLLSEFQKMTVTQIYFKLQSEQSVVSQHLAILRDANLVQTQRKGKSIVYSLNEPLYQFLLRSQDIFKS